MEFLPDEPLETIELPEGSAKLYDEHDFYDSASMAIGDKKVDFSHRAQAELAKIYSDLHRIGSVQIPKSEKACRVMRREWDTYYKKVEEEFSTLAAERTDDEDRQEAIVKELIRLLIG
jgi:3-phenylpropionate/cinnamic acid dioxygenase small subunit